MSSNQTENLNLHQWEKTDIFSRTEFNENFAAIDAAVAGVSAQKADQSALNALSAALNSKVEISTGFYNGNDTTQSINLGYQPKVVLVCNGGYTTMALAEQSNNLLTVTATGFTVSYNSDMAISVNKPYNTYLYLAIR